MPAEALAAFRHAVSLEPDNARGRLGLAVAAIPVFAHDVAESSTAIDGLHRHSTSSRRGAARHPASWVIRSEATSRSILRTGPRMRPPRWCAMGS